MALVDMDDIQFYQPPVKAGLRSDERPTTSGLRVPAPRGGTALGASQDLSRVLHNLDLFQSQKLNGPLQKDSFTSWDDVIPLSCQSDGPHRPRFHYPPGTICNTGVLGKHIAGKFACK